jgi:hypothetical protein
MHYAGISLDSSVVSIETELCACVNKVGKYRTENHIFSSVSKKKLSQYSDLSYELDDWSYDSRRGNVGIYSSPPRPDRFWGTPSLLYRGYRDYFPVR